MTRALLALLLLVALTGCGGSAGVGEDDVTVFAASSLTDVFPEIES